MYIINQGVGTPVIKENASCPFNKSFDPFLIIFLCQIGLFKFQENGKF